MMCRPARSDSNLGAALTVVAVAVVAAAIARPVLHAAETALQIALIAAAVAAGVAALAAVAFIVIRLHRRQARALTALPSSRALAAGQPVKPVTLSTAGSLCTIRTKSASFWRMALRLHLPGVERNARRGRT